MHILH